MSRPNPFTLMAIFAVFVALYGGLSIGVGGLYPDTHDGDVFHLLDILSRMDRGDVPHLDFVTPLGALSFWPVHLLKNSGLPTGMSFLWAQIAVATLLLPIVVYASVTRLSRRLSIYFGCVTLGLVLALSYGTPSSGVGISMYYNRWAWSVTFVVLVLSFVPARQANRPLIDGVLIGLLASALLLLKITYFATIVPVVALVLLAGMRFQAFGVALLVGLISVGLVALLFGFGFWIAYFNDLVLVSSTELRPSLEATFADIIAGPKHIGATIVGLFTILVLRNVAPAAAGIGAILLVPAFLYITYQNFGNDPQWLLIIPVLLLAYPLTEGDVFGLDVKRAAPLVAVASFALFFPSFYNIAMSPVGHLSFDKARFLPALPEPAGHQDVFIRRDRAYMMTAQIYKDQDAGPWKPYAEVIGRTTVPSFQGTSFPHCEWMAGSRALLETIGADLTAANLPDESTLFVADWLVAYAPFSPLLPAKGSAPWYYGRLSGMENTDYVMIPKCAFSPRVRGIIIEELSASEFNFSLVRDNDLFALFAVSPE